MSSTLFLAIKKSQKNASHAKQSGSSKALVGRGKSPLNLPRLYHIRQKNDIITYFPIRIFYIYNNLKRQIKVKESGYMREQIEKLLKSEISTSAIAKGADVPWSTVADLRKGKTSMDKMALLTAEKLYDFAEGLEINQY